jgi:hypothetical protein
MDRAQRAVDVLHRVDDHAKCDQVVDLVEVLALLRHLLIDAVQVLGASGYPRLDPDRLELLAELGDDRGQVVLAGLAALGHHARDLMELVRLEVVEGQVLQLPLDAGDPQPMRQRGVYLHRLASLVQPSFLGKRRQRPHVVQPVGELDEDDPNVLGHRDEHLAQVVALRLRERLELNLAELGDAVDEFGDLVAEPLTDFGERHV